METLKAVVRVVNDRTNRVILNLEINSEVEAYHKAKELAAEFAERYGDEAWHAEREMPFVADPLCAYDTYYVMVFVRDESGYLGWRGQREVEHGFVEATGYCASC